MLEVAQIVRTGREANFIIASRPLADAARPPLAMPTVARTLQELAAWWEGFLPPRSGGDHILVLTALEGGRQPAAVDELSADTGGLALLLDTAGREIAPGESLEAALRSGAVPLPWVAVRLADLAGFTGEEAPVSLPLGPALAADWIAAGRPLRLVSANAGVSAPAPMVEGSAAALRGVTGHVPAAALKRMGALAGEESLAALRRRHARLNGDILGAIGPEAAAELRAAGCGLTRPVRRVDNGPTPWSEAEFSTDLGRFGVELVFMEGAVRRARRAFSSLAAMRESDTCLIVGNGPSLREADPALFARHDVIISNFAVHSPLLAARAKILTVTNGLVAEQGAAAFNGASIPLKVAPLWLADRFHEDAGFVFVAATGETRFFGDDPAAKISWAATVSFFNLQLAYALGYRRALLVGFNHAYTQPADAYLGDVLEEGSEDPNHFDPLYFAKRRWQAADVDGMEFCYHLAAEAYAADGRDIFNLSPASHLTVFPKHPPHEPLPPLRPRTAAPVAPPSPAATVAPLPQRPLPSVAPPAAPAAPAMPAAAAAEAPVKYTMMRTGDSLETPDYRHVVIAVANLRAAGRSWNACYFKLQTMGGAPFLEFRDADFQPAGFSPWPIPDEDEWGPYLRLPLAEPEAAGQQLKAFLAGLTPPDRAAFAAFLGATPQILDKALRDEAHAGWSDTAARAKRLIETSLSVAKPAPAAPAAPPAPAPVAAAAEAPVKYTMMRTGDSLETPDYRHVVIAVANLRAAGRSWNACYFKLQTMGGAPFLEFRDADFQPAGFAPWPIPDEDEWGPYLRLPLAEPEAAGRQLKAFLAGLAPPDRAAFAAFLGAIPEILDKALRDEAYAGWADTAARVKSLMAASLPAATPAPAPVPATPPAAVTPAPAAPVATAPAAAEAPVKYTMMRTGDSLETPDYRHVVIAVANLRAAGRAWSACYFKLQTMGGAPHLELRDADFQPAGFTPWPIPDRDEWGPYLRLPLAEPAAAREALDRFRYGLAPADRTAFDAFLGAIPEILEKALRDEAYAGWRDTAALAESLVAGPVAQ